MKLSDLNPNWPERIDEAKRGNGHGCTCGAYSYSECGCGVDWSDYGLYNRALDNVDRDWETSIF